MKKQILFCVLLCGTMLLQTACKDDSKDEPTVTVTGISLDKTTLSLTIGGTATLTPTITPTNASTQTVTWTTSDTTKATVNNGVVTGIAVGTATIVAVAGTQTATCVVTVTTTGGSISTGTSVLINGVRWATCNVNTPGTFAASPEASGMFYQWNSKTAWPATGSVTGWDASWNGGFATASTSATWATVNDPSPAGYRVPTHAEQQALLDVTKVTHEWTTQNGIVGCKFTDIVTDNSIFLPASGCRDHNVGTLYDEGSKGYYWSSTASGSYNAYGLYFDSIIASWTNYLSLRADGHSVRPVAE